MLLLPQRPASHPFGLWKLAGRKETSSSVPALFLYIMQPMDGTGKIILCEVTKAQESKCHISLLCGPSFEPLILCV